MTPSWKRAPSLSLKLVMVALATSTLVACGNASESGPPATVSNTSEQLLRSENERLKADLAALKAQVEDLKQTPQALLVAVQDAVKAEKLDAAKAALDKLESRYGSSAQLSSAKTDVSKLSGVLQARAEEAKRLEAMGFYALKPKKDTKVDGMLVQVEGLTLGNRWTFDNYDDSYFYRDARRDEKFVLLRTTLKSLDKQTDPNLPDIGIYAIDGKEMKRVASMSYEFRRWSSHGTYIGLYHDFKNDFAHTPAVPFVAGASITTEQSTKPFAVVTTGQHCHVRGKKIGAPEVEYSIGSCDFKTSLSVADFASGEYQVLGFFNKPKGL